MGVLCAALSVVCIFDYTEKRIPNLLVLMIWAAGAVRGFCLNGLEGAGMYLCESAAVLFLLYPLFRIGSLGAGDVKLLSVSAGYFPAGKVFYFLFFSLLVSAVFSIIRLLKERNVRDRAEYFCEYCAAVARSGKWKLYLPEKGEKRLSGICMSGPVLCSVLLGLGGVY